MMSISFLRTLNPKKYQDFAEENRNRLRVYYIRTINKINRMAKLNKQHTKSSNRCMCKHGNCQQSLSANDHRVVAEDHDKDGGHQSRRKLLDLETTRQQCEKKMEKIEKENYMESRKLAWLNRSRRAEGKKNQTATHFHKPV